MPSQTRLPLIFTTVTFTVLHRGGRSAAVPYRHDVPRNGRFDQRVRLHRSGEAWRPRFLDAVGGGENPQFALGWPTKAPRQWTDFDSRTVIRKRRAADYEVSTGSALGDGGGSRSCRPRLRPQTVPCSTMRKPGRDFSVSRRPKAGLHIE